MLSKVRALQTVRRADAAENIFIKVFLLDITGAVWCAMQETTSFHCTYHSAASASSARTRKPTSARRSGSSGVVCVYDPALISTGT